MDNVLGDKCKITLILRLTLTEQGKLLRGEVVELQGKVIGRFTEWPQLSQFVGCGESADPESCD